MGLLTPRADLVYRPEHVLIPASTPRELWLRAWRDSRTYGYVPTGLPGRGTGMDYLALETLKAWRRTAPPPTPGAVLRAQSIRRDDEWLFLFSGSAGILDYARRQPDAR